MTKCPDIDELLALSAGDPGDEAARAHVEGCAACCALVALATFRAVGPRASERPEACAALEPAIAALVDGSIDSTRLGELVGHLGRCAACNDLVARLTLFRGELDDVPEPAAPEAWGKTREEELIVEASVGTAEITQVTKRASANDDGTGAVPRWRRVLPYSAVIATSAVAAAAVMLLIVGRGPEGERAEGPAPRGREGAAVVTAPSARDVADAERRVREAELRVREAKQRSREAELRVLELEARVRELEARAQLSATPTRGDPKRKEAKPGARDADSASRRQDTHLEGTGYLTIVCNPFCDEVFDGGRSLGPSPIVHLSSATGVHQITLRKGSTSKVISVTVVEGQVTAQRISME